MKYIHYAICFLCLHLFTINTLHSQSFLPLTDASGFDTSSYQGDISTAAAALTDILPDEIQDQFKVFEKFLIGIGTGIAGELIGEFAGITFDKFVKYTGKQIDFGKFMSLLHTFVNNRGTIKACESPSQDLNMIHSLTSKIV